MDYSALRQRLAGFHRTEVVYHWDASRTSIQGKEDQNIRIWMFMNPNYSERWLRFRLCSGVWPLTLVEWTSGGASPTQLPIVLCVCVCVVWVFSVTLGLDKVVTMVKVRVRTQCKSKSSEVMETGLCVKCACVCVCGGAPPSHPIRPRDPIYGVTSDLINSLYN